MRKKLLYLLIAIFCSSGSFANAESLSLFDSVTSTPFQLGLWPFQLFSQTAKVYGLNTGTWIWQDDTYGLSIAPLIYQRRHYGVCVSAVDIADNNYGIQFGALSFNKDNRGLQFGGFNHNKDLHGLTAGAVNYSSHNHGLMMGIVNVQDDWSFWSDKGIQIGLFNAAQEGFQFGLINYNEKAWIPWMPFFNCD